MNVACSSCKTQYKIDTSKVPPSGGFIKCKTCGERVEIPPPGVVDPVPLVDPSSEEAIPLAGSEPPDGGAQPPIDPGFPAAGPPKPPLPVPGDVDPIAGPVPEVGLPAAGPPPDLAPGGGGAFPAVDGEHPDLLLPSAPPAARTTPLVGGDADNGLVQTTAAPPHADEVVGKTPPVPPESAPGEEEAFSVVSPPVSVPADAAVSDGAAAQATEPPKFLDNVPPTDALHDLPASLGTEEATPVIEESESPALAQTDAPDSSPLGANLFDDLPAASVGEVTDSPGSMDLPTPEIAPAFDDLPAAEAPSLMDHLPAEAPSLMDELPGDYQAETQISALDGEAMSALQLADTEEQAGSEPAFHPADVDGPIVDSAAATPDAATPPAATPPAATPPAATPDAATPPAAPHPAGRKLVVAIAGGGTAAALVAAVALTTPYLGVQLLDPFGLASEPGESAPDLVPQAKTQAAEAKSNEAAPPLESEPTEPKLVELSTDNVDTLAFAALRDSTAALANEPKAGVADAQALLAWARFRLASRGDQGALDTLVATLPRRPQEISKMQELGAAAAVGGLALSGKLGPARRIGERLHKGRLKESAHLALALSSAYTRRPDQAKALRHLERARRLAPDHPDAAFRRGMILLSGREPEAGVEALTALAAESGDPDLVVQMTGALLDAGQFNGASQAANRFEAAGQIDAVASHRRDLAWRILCYRNLRSGDLTRAAEIAGARAKTQPVFDLRIEQARLTAAAGGDGDALLSTQAEKLEATEAARLLAERVRLALRAGDVEAAKGVLGDKEKLARRTGGWVKLAQGWIARHEGHTDAARAAFQAAAKKKLAEARLEVALLADDKPGALTKKLTELERKTGLPAASYHLAKLMRARGNAVGAAERLERVLWTEPTVIDPLDLVLEWAGAAAQAGDAERATATVAAIRANRLGDLRPAQALIGLKRQAGADDEVVTLYRELVAAKPDNSSFKVELAAALNRTGAHSEAQGLLEELFKQDKAARTPEALVELARAWADREPYRARQLVRESIESDPTAEKYMLVGRLAIQREQIDEARKAYNKAIELNDRALDAYVALARIDLEARAFDEVVTNLQEVLRQQPSHSEAAVTLGDVFVELGKPREAIKRYEVVLAVKESEEVLMKVARLQLQRTGQLGAAIKTLRRTLAINPNLAEAHFHLGMALKDQEQHRDAINSLKKCLSLDPEGEWADEAKRTIQDLENHD